MDGTDATTGTCRVVVDLRGVAWAEDADEVRHRLSEVDGVLAVEPQPRWRKAVIVHDARSPLPALYNFVHACRSGAPAS